MDIHIAENHKDKIEKKEEVDEEIDDKNHVVNKRPWYKINADEFIDEGLSIEEMSKRHNVSVKVIKLRLNHAIEYGYRADELTNRGRTPSHDRPKFTKP